MMRMLSWGPGLGGEKFHSADLKMFASNEVPTVANVPSSGPIGLKRKRSPSLDECLATQQVVPVPDKYSSIKAQPIHPSSISHFEPVTTLKQEPVAEVSLPSPPVTTSPDSRSSVATPPMAVPTEAQLQRMRETISSQMSLEILLKHKELRLIDQEMAKCQVALEQLRRCHEIPYPSMQAPSLSVTEGKGPAVRRSSEHIPAESPAPWGVADGPYTRHYSKWLLPDPRFDGGEPVAISQPVYSNSIFGRSTRGHVVNVVSKPTKSRSQRAELKSLPAGYGQPKEKATGPMILKRKSDGVMVKLVCPDCGRLDFGSAQGFINHCRIGHTRSFASHDAAAEACGEPIQYNDNGTVKGVDSAPTPSNAHVNPLTRSAKLVSQTPMPARAFNIDGRASFVVASQSKNDVASSGFRASAEAPNLSTLIKNRGLGLNLVDIVADAKSKVQLSEPEDEMEEMEVDSPTTANTGRHPQTAGSKQPIQSSMSNSSSVLFGSRLPPPASTTRPSVPGLSRTTFGEPDCRAELFVGLLPSPTNESTQAPSLVDDDEEFDPQTPMSTHDADDLDAPEVDFEVHDDEHNDQVSMRGGDLSGPQPTCAQRDQMHRNQRTVAARALDSEDMGKRNLFVSPSPVPEGSERKRRKLD